MEKNKLSIKDLFSDELEQEQVENQVENQSIKKDRMF